MAITLQNNGRSAGCDAIVDLIDGGVAAGDIQIATAGFALILATITLSDPAYGAATNGVATLSGTPLSDASADNTGTAAVWRARDSDANVIIDGPVATSGGGDINLSTAARNAAIDAICALVNGGDIQFAVDSTFASILLTLTLQTPAFAAAAAGSAAIDNTPALTANASASGTCTAFRFRTSVGAEVWRGTVGTSGADINFDSNIWVSGQPITLSSYNFTLAATSAASDGALVINNTSIVSGQNVEITSGDFDFPAS